jgi:uncharacterized OsmC-like protein
MSNNTIELRLEQQSDYRFKIIFGEGVDDLMTDEPAPLGAGSGPSPLQLLCAATGNCLSDSLLFALRKFKQTPEPIHTRVSAEVGRNESGRLRVLVIRAELQLGVCASALEHLDRVLHQFQDFCTVTQSVGQGIPIEVRVLDKEGVELKA